MELDLEVNYISHHHHHHHRSRSGRVLVERKKIALSRANNVPAASSFGIIIDSLCSSDDESDSEQNMPMNRGPQEPQDTPFNLLKSLSARFGNHGSSRPPRFSPVRKMFDPFVKSNSISHHRKSDEKENRSSPAHLHALLKAGNRRGGATLFEFTVKSTEDYFYAARTRKDENAPARACYTFYKASSSLVGRMHVVVVSCRPLVTEFVLHDIIKERSGGNEIAAVVVQDVRVEGISDISSGGVRMHVLIPAGNHGSPVVSGPARLLDRWRSGGGGCDCGGWDMACTLDVFSNPDLEIADLADDRKPAQLCGQGKRDNVPAFSMRGIGDGKYEVDFHARLSSLQAFSISVAMLHAAGRKRSTSQVSQIDSRKETIESTMGALAKDAEEGGEEISNGNNKEQVMSSFVLNPPFSPIARV